MFLTLVNQKHDSKLDLIWSLIPLSAAITELLKTQKKKTTWKCSLQVVESKVPQPSDVISDVIAYNLGD